MSDPREVAAEIIDLIFHQPHVDADTPLEEVHLLESVADILEEAFGEVESDLNEALADERVTELERETDLLRDDADKLREELEEANRKLEILV
jgi:hypothetical protein